MSISSPPKHEPGFPSSVYNNLPGDSFRPTPSLERGESLCSTHSFVLQCQPRDAERRAKELAAGIQIETSVSPPASSRIDTRNMLILTSLPYPSSVLSS